MSYQTDSLASTLETLIANLAAGRKVITIKTGINGGKKIAIEDVRRS